MDQAFGGVNQRLLPRVARLSVALGAANCYPFAHLMNIGNRYRKTPACIVLTFLVCASPAAAWEEFIYLDRGFAIQFPARPQIRTAAHQSTLVKGLPATIYSAEDDHVVYRITVVELAGHTDAATNLLNEAAYFLMREGDVLFSDFPRVYQDERAIYGVTLVVDRKDKSRARSSLYISRARLYIAEAIVQPARGDNDMTVPSRFDQTIRFPPDGRFD